MVTLLCGRVLGERAVRLLLELLTSPDRKRASRKGGQKRQKLAKVLFLHFPNLRWAKSRDPNRESLAI